MRLHSAAAHLICICVLVHDGTYLVLPPVSRTLRGLCYSQFLSTHMSEGLLAQACKATASFADFLCYQSALSTIMSPTRTYQLFAMPLWAVELFASFSKAFFQDMSITTSIIPCTLLIDIPLLHKPTCRNRLQEHFLLGAKPEEYWRQ